MNPVLSFPKKEMPKLIIYLVIFLFALHAAPATYINSTFLEQFVGSDYIGFIFSSASVLALVSFIVIRSVLKKKGNYKTFLFFLTLDLISLCILSLSLFYTSGIWSYLFIGAYVMGFVSRNICFLNLDIFLEQLTNNEETGGVRGISLTAVNTALIIGPFMAGILITDIVEAGKVYILGLFILIPVFIMTVRFLSNFKDSYYKKIGIWDTFIEIYKNKDLRMTFSVNFILRFFYSWMVIYFPIFLTKTIGFSISQATLIISIALISFIILQIPTGRISDKYLGEKEIMTIGLIILGLATVSMSFFTDINSLAFWATILFIGRIGASFVEVANETHIFKRVDDDSLNIISFYRAMRPIVYIISPLFASLLLLFAFFELSHLFIVLGIICLTGIFFSLSIKDTK
jgi:MFS family permease